VSTARTRTDRLSGVPLDGTIIAGVTLPLFHFGQGSEIDLSDPRRTFFRGVSGALYPITSASGALQTRPIPPARLTRPPASPRMLLVIRARSRPPGRVCMAGAPTR
jgi:hypothetical protein